MKKTNYIIILISILFSILSLAFQTTIYDWNELGHNVLNDFHHPISIGTNTFVNVFNKTIQSESQQPVWIDINNDSMDDFVIIDAGLIKSYFSHYPNQSVGFTLIDQQDSLGMISVPILYLGSSTDVSIKMIGYNLTHFLNYKMTSNGMIEFVSSSSFGVNKTFVDFNSLYYPKSSASCIVRGFQSYCAMRVNNSVGLVNFTTDFPEFGSTVRVITPSVYNFTQIQMNYKPAYYPIGNDDMAVFYCSQAGKSGIALVNYTGGNVYKTNCTITLTTETIVGSPKVFHTPMSGSTLYDIVFAVRDSAGIATTKTYFINNQLKGETNYAPVDNGISNSGQAGFGVNGNYLYSCYQTPTQVAIIRWTISGTSPTDRQGYAMNRSGTSSGADGDMLITGGDYAYCGGIIYSEYYNQTQYVDNSGKNSPCWMAQVSGNHIETAIGDNYHGVELCSDNTMRAYHLKASPITYANATVCFNNNITNQSVELSLGFSMYNNDSVEIYSDSVIGGAIPPSCTKLPSGFQTGLYNVTNLRCVLCDGGSFDYFSKDWNVVNQRINITTGTNTYYIYMQPNITNNASLFLTFYDNNIKFPITEISSFNNFTDVFLYKNSTQTLYLHQNTTTSEIQLNNIIPDYYKFVANVKGYGTYVSNVTYISGTMSLNIYLTPNFLNPNITAQLFFPWIRNIDVYAYMKTIYSNGSINYNEIYQPSYICINGTIYLNTTISKKNTNTPSVLYKCEDNIVKSSLGVLFDTNVFTTSTIYSYLAIPTCSFNTSGNKQISLIPYSADFQYNFGNYTPISVINITVSDTCIGTLENNLLNPKTPENDGITGSIDFFMMYVLGAKSNQAKIMWGLILMMMFALGGGAGLQYKLPNTQGVFVYSSMFIALIMFFIFTKTYPIFSFYISFIFGLFFIAFISVNIKDFIGGKQ